MLDYDRTHLDNLIADAVCRGWVIHEFTYTPRTNMSGPTVILSARRSTGEELGEITFVAARSGRFRFHGALIWELDTDSGPRRAVRSTPVGEIAFYNKVTRARVMAERVPLAEMLDSGVAHLKHEKGISGDLPQVTLYSLA